MILNRLVAYTFASQVNEPSQVSSHEFRVTRVQVTSKSNRNQTNHDASVNLLTILLITISINTNNRFCCQQFCLLCINCDANGASLLFQVVCFPIFSVSSVIWQDEVICID